MEAKIFEEHKHSFIRSDIRRCVREEKLQGEIQKLAAM